MRSFVIFVVSALSFFSSSAHAALAPSIEVSDKRALIDLEVCISIKGLIPKEEVQIVAETVDDHNVGWSSEGYFIADASGEVDLSIQEPVRGSYHGVDAMGLFWSMQAENTDVAAFKVSRDEIVVTLKAFRGKEEIASTEVVRMHKSPEVRRISVQENGLVGALFMPPSDKPLPVIIVLSGSNGGLSENRAQLLASHGFAVLALGYFGLDGLPDNLQDIPLEYFENAFAWLRSQPKIDGGKVGIYGVSRGGELALILGSWFPDSVQAVAAVVPSSAIYGGLGYTPVHAWLYGGKPLAPYAPVTHSEPKDGQGQDPSNAIRILDSFLEGMKDVEAFEAASIPVEKMRASLLLVSGGDDQMWPSGYYSQCVVERLKKYGSGIYCQHLHYPKAGHGIAIPNLPQPGPAYYHPVAKLWFSMGGTPEDDEHASLDSWKKIIDFFKQALL